MIDVPALARMVDEDVAALMITNPNTLGVRGEHPLDRRDSPRQGALLYMDGANMNALAGLVRPATTAWM